MTPETTQALTTHEGEKFNYLQRIGKLMAASGYFTDAKDAAQAAVKILAGDELGIPPVASMMGIYIVQGKVQLGGNLIASRIRAHGYDYHVSHISAEKCVIEFRSRLNAENKRTVLGESSFSIQDAEKAGIASATYKKYPRNMLFNRAISNGAKWFVPDVFSGIPIYSEGELEAEQSATSQAVDDAVDSYVNAAIQKVVAVPEPEPPTVAPIQPASFAEKLAVYTREKKRVGAEAYYRVLAAHGYEHANEVVKRPLLERQTIYNELKALPDLADTAQAPL